MPPKKRTIDDFKQLVDGGPPYEDRLLNALRRDRRAGVKALYRMAARRQERYLAEAARVAAMLDFEREAQTGGFARIAGVDEAGRGPLAGPLVAGAVVLGAPIDALNDSKLLAEEAREALFALLNDGTHDVGVGIVEVDELNRIGLQAANYRAMALAVEALKNPPDFLLVDGFPLPGVIWPQKHVIKGDRRSMSIAAASIIAKVTRDRLMVQYHDQYPHYGFLNHKGYSTEEHFAALRAHGPCPLHRTCFGPVMAVSQGMLSFMETEAVPEELCDDLL